MMKVLELRYVVVGYKRLGTKCVWTKINRCVHAVSLGSA